MVEVLEGGKTYEVSELEGFKLLDPTEDGKKIAEMDARMEFPQMALEPGLSIEGMLKACRLQGVSGNIFTLKFIDTASYEQDKLEITRGMKEPFSIDGVPAIRRELKTFKVRL